MVAATPVMLQIAATDLAEETFSSVLFSVAVACVDGVVAVGAIGTVATVGNVDVVKIFSNYWLFGLQTKFCTNNT